MFAGPNGSGKSTLKPLLGPLLLGVYLNPDELEQEIRSCGHLDLQARQVIVDADELLGFFQKSTLLQNAKLHPAVSGLTVREGRLIFGNVPVNAYFASVAADFLRHKLLEQKVSFTFETVMSSPDKIAFLAKAQRAGYRTYLYYIATEDPEINVSRVRNRVSLGGHPVPEDKIVSRYWRSLDLLMDAIAVTNRAYIFDNSAPAPENQTVIAEITEGRVLEIKTDQMPAWFKRAVWDKITGPKN
jgi:predicted ABC-type ATPase